MNPEEEGLYAEMRAAIRGDQERAAKRAAKKESNPVPASPQEPTSPPDPPGPRRFVGVRRLFGGRHDPA